MGQLVIPQRGFDARAAGFDPLTLFQFSFDGADGATTTVDDSGIHTLTAAGDVQLDTAQSIDGGASSLHDGTGDWWVVSDTVDNYIPATNFTFECWVRFPALTGTYGIFSWVTDANNMFGIECDFANSQGIRAIQVEGGSLTINCSQGANTGWSTYTWHHIHYTRTGDDHAVGRDGTRLASVNDTTALYLPAQQLHVGGHASADTGNIIKPHAGWIDEARLRAESLYPDPTYTVPTPPF